MSSSSCSDNDMLSDYCSECGCRHERDEDVPLFLKNEIYKLQMDRAEIFKAQDLETGHFDLALEVKGRLINTATVHSIEIEGYRKVLHSKVDIFFAIMELQGNARYYGSIFGGILGASEGYEINVRENALTGIYAGGLYGICAGDHIGGSIAFVFQIIFSAWVHLDANMDKIAARWGGIIGGTIAFQTGIAVAKDINSKIVQ